MPLRIAMWSGPRNISTAMMRAWENRPDATVIDEPFYACYLAGTALDHPGRDEVIASQATDWRQVAKSLIGPIPGGKAIYYQKHMTHHILPGFGRDWIDEVTNCFLVRLPAEVVASYVETRRSPTLEDLGFVQQGEIFDRVADRLGRAPPVLDAADVLRDPAGMLAALCRAVGVEFDARMLSWPPGPRASDGVWAKHWYASVEKSTGFNPLRANSKPMPRSLQPLAEAALPVYERLVAHRLQPVREAGQQA